MTPKELELIKQMQETSANMTLKGQYGMIIALLSQILAELKKLNANNT